MIKCYIKMHYNSANIYTLHKKARRMSPGFSGIRLGVVNPGKFSATCFSTSAVSA